MSKWRHGAKKLEQPTDDRQQSSRRRKQIEDVSAGYAGPTGKDRPLDRRKRPPPSPVSTVSKSRGTARVYTDRLRDELRRLTPRLLHSRWGAARRYTERAARGRLLLEIEDETRNRTGRGGRITLLSRRFKRHDSGCRMTNA